MNREATKPIRVQRKRTKGWLMPVNTIYVGRPSKFGNPFNVTEERSHGEAVIAFNIWLTMDGITVGISDKKQKILDSLHELQGKNLACWCAIGGPCHADVLLEVAALSKAKGE